MTDLLPHIFTTKNMNEEILRILIVSDRSYNTVVINIKISDMERTRLDEIPK